MVGIFKKISNRKKTPFNKAKNAVGVTTAGKDTRAYFWVKKAEKSIRDKDGNLAKIVKEARKDLGLGNVTRPTKVQQRAQKRRDKRVERLSKGDKTYELKYRIQYGYSDGQADDNRAPAIKNLYFRSKDLRSAKTEVNDYLTKDLPSYVIRYDFISLKQTETNIDDVDIAEQRMYEVSKQMNYQMFKVDANVPEEDKYCVQQFIWDRYYPLTNKGSNGKLRAIGEKSISPKTINQLVANHRASIEAGVPFNMCDTNSDEVVTGITPREINEVIAPHLRVRHYCFDVLGNEVLYYTPEKPRKLPPLMYITNGDHCFPVSNAKVVKAIANRYRKTQHEEVSEEDKEESVTEEDIDIILNNCFENVEQALLVEATGTIYLYKQCDLRDYMISKSVETNTVYSTRCYRVTNGRIVKFKESDDRTWIINSDIEEVANACKALNIPFKNSGMTSFVSDFIKEQKGVVPMSTMNYDTFNRVVETQRGGFNSIFHQPTKVDKKEKHFCGADLIKAHTSVLKQKKFTLYTSFDPWVACSSVEKKDPWDSLYDVRTTNFFPLKGDSLYTKDLVQYAINHGIKLQITGKIVPTGEVVEFSKLVDDLIETFGPKMAKTLINCFVGMCGQAMSQQSNLYYDQNLKSCAQRFLKLGQGDQFVTKVHSTPDLFEINDYSKRANISNNLPIWIGIVQAVWLKINKLSLIAEQFGGKLVQTVTDCCIFQFDNEAQAKKLTRFYGERMGDFSALESEKVDEKIKRCGKVNAKLVKERVSKKLKEIKEELKPVSMRIYWDIDESNWRTSSEHVDESVDTIIEAGGGLICGFPGTGKSYVTRELLKRLREGEGYETHGTAFTNCAANIIKGKTLHRTFKMDACSAIENANISKFRKGDWLIVDEVSMVPSKFYAILLKLKQRGVNIVLVGDYNQLRPVMDGAYDYENSQAVRDLTNGHVIELKVNKRSDSKLFNLFQKIIDGGFDVNDFQKSENAPRPEDWNICYTNPVVARVNRFVMRTYSKKLPESDRLIFKATGGPMMGYRIPQMILWKGARVRCTKSIRSMAIAKNEFFTIDSWDEARVYLNRMDGSETITVYRLPFHRQFMAGFASTCHKVQGSTLKGKVNVFQWDFHYTDARWLYTAVSRATCWENVHFMMPKIEEIQYHEDPAVIDLISENKEDSEVYNGLIEAIEAIKDIGILRRNCQWMGVSFSEADNLETLQGKIIEYNSALINELITDDDEVM
jgi:hypothetical protein